MKDRVEKLEETVVEHNRRITDNTNAIGELHIWRATIAEATEVNRKMVEVGENIIEALGWLGRAATWIAKMSAAVGAIYAGIKFSSHWWNNG